MNGRGDEVGKTCSPQKILAAVIRKRSDVARPMSRTPRANSLGILMSNRAVAHKAVPAPKEGTLPSGPAAAPERMTPSPIANTRKPAPTKSLPFLKYFKVNKAVAMTRPAPSIAHAVLCRCGCVAKVPARPKTAPSARPMDATTFRGRWLIGIISILAPRCSLRSGDP